MSAEYQHYGNANGNVQFTLEIKPYHGLMPRCLASGRQKQKTTDGNCGGLIEICQSVRRNYNT